MHLGMLLSLYQKSICYGFVDRNSKKITILEKLIYSYPDSPSIDDAYFELGVTYTATGSLEMAIKTYEKLVSRFPQSPYIPRALLNKGLILYNQEKLVESQEILKYLLVRYSKDGVAKQALGTLKEISIDLDKVPEFTLWLRTLKIDSFTDNELERTAFAVAEKQFLSVSQGFELHIHLNLVQIKPLRWIRAPFLCLLFEFWELHGG